jgi:hypothetical protein
MLDEERQLSEQGTAEATRYVYAEANLAMIGYYDAGYKRRRPTETSPSKVIQLPDGRRFEIVPTAKYGYPNTQDLDIQRAFESVLLEQVQRRQSVDQNGDTQRRQHFKLPIAVSIGEIVRRAGRATTEDTIRASDRKAVRDWVRRHTATTIEGPLKLGKPGEPAGSFSTHLFNESYVPGDTTKRGDKADTIMLWPAGWYLSNLAYNFTYLVDAAFHERIGRFPIAKNLYPVLLAGFLAADPHPFKKMYTDTVQLFGMPPQRKPSDRERQLGPSFDRLHKLGFLARFKWDHRETDSLLIYWPGEKARADMAAKKVRRDQAIEIDTQATRPAALPAPTATEPDDQAEAQAAVAAMFARDLEEASGDHHSADNWRYLATKCVTQRRPHLVHQAISELKAADNVGNRGAFLNSRLRDLMKQFELFPSSLPTRKQATPATPSTTTPPTPLAVTSTPSRSAPVTPPAPEPSVSEPRRPFRDIVAEHAPEIAARLAAREQGTATVPSVSSPPVVAVPDAPSRGLAEDPAPAGARPPGMAPGSASST